VRTWASSERVRVIFDLTSPVGYGVFSLESPYRVVVDFEGAVAGQGLSLPSRQTERIKGMRYARRGPKNLRVVIDLAQNLVVRHQSLEPNHQYGHRVVLDLSVATDRPTRSAELAISPIKAPSETELTQVVVAIDAGHGGEDVGAIGPRGTYEKDIVLAVARELKNYIDNHPGMSSVLTRNGDYYLKLRTRMAKARKQRADLFISIHADAFHDQRVRGSSVYVLSQKGASSEAAKWLADNENAADLIGGVTLEDKDDVLKSVLIDLSQTASIEASIDAANSVLESLSSLGGLHKKRVQQAGFAVLKSPDIPSILVEMAFISNPIEEERLRNTGYRKKLAGTIYSGIVDYFESNGMGDASLAMNRQHTVARGDTLSTIAVRYAVSISNIELANNRDTETLRIGEVLRIP